MLFTIKSTHEKIRLTIEAALMQTTRARPWPDYKAAAAALCSHTQAARPGVTCDLQLRHLKTHTRSGRAVQGSGADLLLRFVGQL